MDDQKQEEVDFAYAIDCTGSMGSYISKVQEDIRAVVSKMDKEFPQFKLRLGCVGYRDWCDGGDRLEHLDFTNDVSNFEKFVGALKARGGGDLPEDVLGGLNKATELSWRSNLRVLYHICDAPPHHKIYHDYSDDHPDGHSSDPKDYHKIVLQKMKDKNIHLCIEKLNDTTTKMIKVFTEYANEIELTIEEKPLSNCDQLLESISKALQVLAKARMIVKDVGYACDAVNEDLDKLSFETLKDIKLSEIKVNEISNDITNIQSDIDTTAGKLNEAKTEYDEMKGSLLYN